MYGKKILTQHNNCRVIEYGEKQCVCVSSHTTATLRSLNLFFYKDEALQPFQSDTHCKPTLLFGLHIPSFALCRISTARSKGY